MFSWHTQRHTQSQTVLVPSCQILIYGVWATLFDNLYFWSSWSGLQYFLFHSHAHGNRKWTGTIWPFLESSQNVICSQNSHLRIGHYCHPKNSAMRKGEKKRERQREPQTFQVTTCTSGDHGDRNIKKKLDEFLTWKELPHESSYHLGEIVWDVMFWGCVVSTVIVLFQEWANDRKELKTDASFNLTV